MTVFYIPRVHTKHSSRDIRTTFWGLGFGTNNLSVDLAFNPSTGFNIAFIFYNNHYWAKSQNLEILKSCLLQGTRRPHFPRAGNIAGILDDSPSKANHAKGRSRKTNEPCFQADNPAGCSSFTGKCERHPEDFRRRLRTRPHRINDFHEKLLSIKTSKNTKKNLKKTKNPKKHKKHKKPKKISYFFFVLNIF